MRLEMGETRWNGRGQGGVLIAFHLDLVCSGHLAPNKWKNGSSTQVVLLNLDPSSGLPSWGDTKSITHRAMGTPTEP